MLKAVGLGVMIAFFLDLWNSLPSSLATRESDLVCILANLANALPFRFESI